MDNKNLIRFVNGKDAYEMDREELHELLSLAIQEIIHLKEKLEGQDLDSLLINHKQEYLL